MRRGWRVLACAAIATFAVPAALLANDEPATAPPASEDAPQAVGAQPPDAPAAPPAPQSEQPAPGGGPPGAEPPAPSDADAVPMYEPRDRRRGRPRARSGDGRPKRNKARPAAVGTVVMRNIKFNPRKITIDPGDTVRWRNEDDVEHNAIGRNGSFETRLIDGGETSQHTFKRSGVFRYFCTIHEGMTGTVTVSGSASGESGGGSGSGGGGTSPTGSDGTGTSSGTSGSGISSLGDLGSRGSSFSGSGNSTSSLPSTGLDLVWLALAGAALLGVGAAARLLAARAR